MSRRGGVWILTVAVLLVAAQGGHASNGLADFTATLWAGSLGQKAKLYNFSDIDCYAQDCLGVGSAGPAKPRFPARALRIGSAPRAVRIDSHLERRRPITLLQYWAEVDEKGEPIGDPTPIEHRLQRKGSHRWRVKFTTPALEPEAFIDLRARWAEELGATSFARFGLHLAE